MLRDIIKNMKKTNKERKSLDELTRACIEKYDNVTDSRMCIIDAEFRQGFELMKDYPKTVTIFGSARLKPETKIYKRVESLAKKIANLDYTIVTGGGHGIMGAANKGAFESKKGNSLGINISLPFEQTTNPYLNDTIEFHHFYSRKVVLSYAAEAYVYCPGGFGTMDEMFEILTLKQTGKIPDTPIILYGSDFWQPLENYFKEIMLKDGEATISPEDLSLYIITDNDEEVIEIIKNAKIRTDIFNSHHLGKK
jgi:uncharacterized protein (TIGR00730 family)